MGRKQGENERNVYWRNKIWCDRKRSASNVYWSANLPVGQFFFYSLSSFSLKHSIPNTWKILISQFSATVFFFFFFGWRIRAVQKNSKSKYLKPKLEKILKCKGSYNFVFHIINKSLKRLEEIKTEKNHKKKISRNKTRESMNIRKMKKCRKYSKTCERNPES